MAKKNILFFGVIFFRICKLIEKSSNFNFKLIIDKSDVRLIKEELDDEYPWLEINNSYKKISNLFPDKFYTKVESKFDIVIFSDDSLLYAYSKKIKDKYFFPIGYDLTQLPFYSYQKYKYLFVPKMPKTLFIAFLQRSRLRKMDGVICSNFQPFKRALIKLKINKKFADRFLPLPINYTAFEKMHINNSFSNFENKFTFFYPNRIIFNNSENVSSGQTKNTEMFIKSLSILVNNYNYKNLLVYFIENKSSVDTFKAKILIKKLGVEKYCRWIMPDKKKDRLTANQMAQLYFSCDAVIGDLGSSWFGQTTIESSFFGKPIVAKCDKEFMVENFGYNPFVEVHTEIDMSQKLYMLCTDKEFYSEMSKYSKIWFETNFSKNTIREYYINLISRMVNHE
jgi:glycosyltransferase involved in cell wall biosynthesis